MNTTYPQLIDELIERVTALNYNDRRGVDAVRKRATMLARNMFGDSSGYVTDLSKVGFYPNTSPFTESRNREAWVNGQVMMINTLQTMKEELTLFGRTAKDADSGNASSTTQSNKIFVVHGHDEGMKQSVARTLEKLELDAVILHEKANKGRTVIEKFSDHADVSFAVVLLSPDDEGYAKADGPQSVRSRARQNVVFELGFFLGRLGRDRVLALYRHIVDFEIPTDYSGVLFVPFDTAGRWQFELVKELKAAGYTVDANQILP